MRTQTRTIRRETRFGVVISQVPVVRASLTGQTAIRRMADDLLHEEATRGSVTADDLKRVGWPQGHITAYLDAACLAAHAHAVR
jgi:hypothetical protein